MQLLRAAVIDKLRVHPRVGQQKLGGGADSREKLLAGLPHLAPFRDHEPRQIVAVLDWDHRLPSQRLALRLYLNYDEAAEHRFEEAWVARTAAIARRDLYPEFDVPDYDELPADEAYDAEVTTSLVVEGMRLTSPWRRAIDPRLAEEAVAVVRGSAPFQKVKAAEPARPLHLGDLDPVSWMPPCESGHERWTIDVWWLTAFDGRMGTGWSFLVDLFHPEERAAVVTHREFTVRAG